MKGRTALEIYITQISELMNEDIYNRAYASLPQNRKDKADRIKMQQGRCQSVAAGLLLNYAVRNWTNRIQLSDTENNEIHNVSIQDAIEEYNQKYDYETVTGSSGKPYFRNFPDIFFNISHSGKYVVCAVSDKEVGIDIEGGRKASISLAKRFFCQEEASWINEEDSEDRFFRIWTLKEAYGKAVGCGVLEILSKVVYKIIDGEMKAYINDDIQSIKIIEFGIENYKIAAIEL